MQGPQSVENLLPVFEHMYNMYIYIHILRCVYMNIIPRLHEPLGVISNHD